MIINLMVAKCGIVACQFTISVSVMNYYFHPMLGDLLIKSYSLQMLIIYCCVQANQTGGGEMLGPPPP